ncbi:MAG TPA: endospore germination permease [Selenomonadales bacterium]|nr:endospore germination permease [Selenomonadales bacterium]
MTEHGKITAGQLTLLITNTVLASAILFAPSAIVKHAGTDAWLSLLIATLAGGMLALLAIHLCKLFPGATIFEFPELLLGKVLGKATAILYIWWNLHICAEVIHEFSFLMMTAFMPETPILVFHLIMTAIAAYAVWHGLEVLARVAQLFVPFILISTLFLFVLAIPQMHMAHLFPIFDTDPLSILKGSAVPLSWFGEIMAFTAVLPFLNNRAESSTRSVLFGIFLVFLFFLITVVGVVALLGPVITAANLLPLLTGARLIHISTFVERVDPVLVIVIVLGGFLKISLFYWVAAFGSGQIAGLRDYRPIVVPVGFFLFVLSMSLHESPADLLDFLGTIWPVYAIGIFEAGIPVVLLAVGIYRAARGRGDSQ